MNESTAQRVSFIKTSVGIYDVLAHYGEKHSRQSTPHQISCPFRTLSHGKGTDSHRSARIYPRTNSVYCWACGEGGDVIWIVQRMQGFKTCEETCEFIEKTFKLIKEKKDVGKQFFRAVKRFVEKKDPNSENRRKLDSLRHVLDSELAVEYRNLISKLSDTEILLVEASLDYFWNHKDSLDSESSAYGDYDYWLDKYFDWYNKFKATIQYYDGKARLAQTLSDWKKEIDSNAD